MDIPIHLQAALSCTSPLDEPALASAAETSGIALSIFGLSSLEFAKAVAASSASNVTFTSFNVNTAPRDWKYLELSLDGMLELVVCFTPSTISIAPPTSAGEFLAQGWQSLPAIVTDSAIPAALVVVGTTNELTLSAFSTRFVSEWANAASALEGNATCPSWYLKNQMNIGASARFLGGPSGNPKFQELFIEAVSELKPKWRFLALYRILEHGYLSEVFQTLVATFFDTPKESLAAASKSIETEIKQFISLSKTASLQTQFETIYNEFERLKLAGNRFVNALDRSMQQSGQLGQANGNRSEIGVIIVYKIRCAIVHAGQSSPIYDAYPDGPILLDALLPVLESISLTFLGITIA